MSTIDDVLRNVDLIKALGFENGLLHPRITVECAQCSDLVRVLDRNGATNIAIDGFPVVLPP